MQLFITDVAFAAKETDLTIAIAEKLHRPPFPTDPPINFHIQLFRKGRNSGHTGKGILTLPTIDIGNTFLQLYGNSINVRSRIVHFKASNRRPNEGLIQRVATSPWEDPERLKEEQRRISYSSAPIPLSGFSFGRFCQDQSFSAEDESPGKGEVICDISSRQLLVQYKTAPAERLDTSFLDTSFLSGFQETRTTSICYRATDIRALVDSDFPYVFLESDLPPVFQCLPTSELSKIIEIFGMKKPIAERLSSFRTDSTMPPVSRYLCLAFERNEDKRSFLQRCRMLHLPLPFPRSILFVRRGVYAKQNIAKLDEFMRSISYQVAFEVEKVTTEGLLEPLDITATLAKELRDLDNQQPLHAAAIFRQFASSLPPPSLTRRKMPRRRRMRLEESSAQLDLCRRLQETITDYMIQATRPKSRYSPSPAVYQSYHLIITPSTQVLEGPLPDQSNSVLRRYRSNESFLRVSFQDENRSRPRREPNLDINQLLDKRYKSKLVRGFKLAGRPFEFLGYSMSGLKEYSFLFVTPFMFEGEKLNAEAIRARQGDFSKLAYRPALLGARWAQAFSATDPTIVLQSHEVKRNVDDIVSVTGSVFTDGCSSISPELARVAWSKLQRARRMFTRSKVAPSAWQFRLGGAKGVAVQDPNLSGRVIHLRKSQEKYDAPDVLTLDIATTSARPLVFFLNRPLILLLEHHGVAANSFLNLQNIAVQEVQEAGVSLLRASQLFQQHGLGPAFRLPSLFNNIYKLLHLNIADSLGANVRHELIDTCIAFGKTHVLRDIKHRARIPVPGSFTLIGVSDEWDCLDEGEVYATVRDEKTGEYQEITGRVVITRSPQIHPGDVQIVNAVRRPQLAHLYNVVVFSCRGRRSLPSCLGGGDLDGDIYNLILDPDLFPPGNFCPEPGSYEALPYKETVKPCGIEDVASFVVDFIKSDLVGYISILHMRIADLNGPDCQPCLDLAKFNSHAVDYPKRGAAVEFKNLPHPPDRIKPDYLSGEGTNPNTNDYYPSKKILGELFRRVPLDEYRPDPDEYMVNPSDGAKIATALRDAVRGLELPSLAVVDDDLEEEMRHIFDAYVDQLFVIAKTHTISKRADDYLSEAELVSGTLQAKWADPHRRREAVTAMNLQTQELTKAIRHEFQVNVMLPDHRGDRSQDDVQREEDEDEYDEYDDEDYDELVEQEEARRDAQNETFRRAWAAWSVAEEALEGNSAYFGAQSFGLIALGTLLEMVKTRKGEFLAED